MDTTIISPLFFYTEVHSSLVGLPDFKSGVGR